VLRTTGVDALSTGAIARWLKVSPSAVTHRAPRHETVALIVQGVGRRWLQWSVRGLRATTVPPLPTSPEERHGVRVWLAVEELARTQKAAGHPEACERYEYFIGEERRLVEEWWGSGAGAGAHAFEAFYTLLAALRSGLAREAGAIDDEVARALLASAIGRPVAFARDSRPLWR